MYLFFILLVAPENGSGAMSEGSLLAAEKRVSFFVLFLKLIFHVVPLFPFYALKHIYMQTNGFSSSARATAFDIIQGLSRGDEKKCLFE